MEIMDKNVSVGHGRYRWRNVGLFGGVAWTQRGKAELQKAVTYTTKSYFVVLVGRGPASFKNLKQFGKILGSWEFAKIHSKNL